MYRLFKKEVLLCCRHSGLFCKLFCAKIDYKTLFVDNLVGGLDWYNFFGTINTAFIFFSLIGVFSQLRKIWKRKSSVDHKHEATAQLSINNFTVSFLAYLSFYVYGYSIEPFNHFIVWPRMIASLLVFMILYEIWNDRRTKSAFSSCLFAAAVLITAIVGMFLGSSFNDESRKVSTMLIVSVSAFIAQGYYHQTKLILKSGTTGAVDLRMSQFILLMDCSTIAFALSIGLKQGWPLMLLATTSGITKLIIMYCFVWVKNSPVAKRRRMR